MIIRSVDRSFYYSNAEKMRYDDSYYPKYLTNDNVFDDVAYLLNKGIFFNDTLDILAGYHKEKGKITSFDEAFNWNDKAKFGKKYVLKGYKRSENKASTVLPAEDELSAFQKNINLNLVETVKTNPQIQFYYFLTPYSVVYWDSVVRGGTLERVLIGEKMVIESLVPYENMHLISVSDDLSITSNLDNYSDMAHFSEEINAYILQCMSEDKHRLTKDNYQEYLIRMRQIYSTFDYDSLFK